jgi:hypothetical protein
VLDTLETKDFHFQFVQVRHLAGQNKSFFGNLWDNLKQDMEKNKEMKVN